MKKNNKFVISMICLLICLFANCINAFAATYGDPEATSYSGLGSKYKNGVNYSLSIAFGGKCAYLNKKMLTPIYHVKNTGDTTLTSSVGVSEGNIQTKKWTTNASVNAAVGSSLIFTESIGFSSDLGYGEEYSANYSVGYTHSISKQIKSSDDTGYYSMTPGQTYYKLKCTATSTTSGSTTTMYFRMPYGGSVIYVVYSPDNRNYVVYE